MKNGNILFDGLVGGSGGETFRRRVIVRSDYAEDVARSLAEELKEKIQINESGDRSRGIE
jgi:hypothetical protein